MQLPRLPVLTPETQPKVRADCLPGGKNSARPCGWTTCRHSLAAEGSTTESCVLDVVDRSPGGITLEEVGDLLQVTRERIRQIETRALKRIGRLRSAASRELRDLAADE